MSATDETRIAALLRFFPSQERLKSFMAGDLYLNTPHYYRRLETIGVGDDFDACVAFHAASKHPIPPRIVVDGETLDLSRVSEVLIYLDEDRFDAHLQCWTIVHYPESDEDLVSLKNDLTRIRQEFGIHHALLPIENLETYLRRVWKSARSPMRAEAVSYSSERLQGAMFVKRKTYQYQREYRVAIGKVEKGTIEPRQLQLGELSDLIHPNAYLRVSVNREETMLLTPQNAG